MEVICLSSLLWQHYCWANGPLYIFPASLGAIFGMTTCLSAQLREAPDDPLNYFIGGCASGVFLGARSESGRRWALKLGLVSPVLTALCLPRSSQRHDRHDGLPGAWHRGHAYQGGQEGRMEIRRRPQAVTSSALLMPWTTALLVQCRIINIFKYILC